VSHPPPSPSRAKRAPSAALRHRDSPIEELRETIRIAWDGELQA
jgi:hypothetical protein